MNKKYKNATEAREDGWNLISCALPTTYNYYSRNGQVQREDEIFAENNILP